MGLRLPRLRCSYGQQSVFGYTQPMSLLVCLLGTDGLVLATDSRGTFGDPRGVTAQNDLITKLYLANQRVGIMVAGAGDLGSTVVTGFMALPDTASLGITDLTMALHRYARGEFRQWFELFAIRSTGTETRPPRPDLNFIVAGFDLNHEPKIYRMSSSLDFAPMLHNYGFGIEGVAQYALYLLNRLYDPASEVKDLQCLAAYVITETASQDGKVGGAVQMAIITAQGSQIVSTGGIEEISLTNRERSQTLKKSFYGLTTIKSQKAPSEQVPSALPRVVPIEDNLAISDATFGITEEVIGDCSDGIAW
jgi:20S proteasome alpha/beta subunit